MRILYLSTWFPYPPTNGSEIRSYHLLRSLALSHQVTVVAFQSMNRLITGQSPLPQLDNLTVHPVGEDPFRYVSSMPARMLGLASPIPLACWPSKLMRQGVERVTGDGGWDAIVAFQTPAALYAIQTPGTARILDVDTAYSYQARERYSGQEHPIKRLRSWVSWQKVHQYERQLFRRFQACTVVSSEELDHVRAMVRTSGGRVEVIPNGVDCQHNRPGLAQPVPNKLIFNGALTYSVNFDAMQFFLAEIYPRIQERLPNTTLTITGSTAGVDLAYLRRDRTVQFSGYVDDIRSVVAGAWACVVPIRKGGGTRLKILEAMALGTPVVSTSKGAEGLAVTPGRNILIADEPRELATQVVRLLGDVNLRQNLAVEARRLVEQCYDWRAIGRRFVGLIEDVVSGSPE